MKTILFVMVSLVFLSGCFSIRTLPEHSPEFQSAQPDSPIDISNIDGSDYRKKLEARLHSRQDKELYSKVLPYLKDDAERIEFLSLPSFSQRQSWIQSKKLWTRAQSSDEQQAVEAGDIAIGMTGDLVRRSWGEPVNIEGSGNPLYRNERWKYIRNISSASGFKPQKRFVYFEAGRVAGWETEN